MQSIKSNDQNKYQNILLTQKKLHRKTIEENNTFVFLGPFIPLIVSFHIMHTYWDEYHLLSNTLNKCKPQWRKKKLCMSKYKKTHDKNVPSKITIYMIKTQF